MKTIINTLLYKGLLAIAIMACLPQKSSAKNDSEGFPIVYLRGTFGHSFWQTDENYRFQRSGNTYSLEIGTGNPIPAGEFKIADEDWIFDFGSPEANFSINTSSIVSLYPAGPNISTLGIYDATISFSYPQNHDQLMVNFEIRKASEEVKDPVSGSLPVMYINVYTDDSHSHLQNEIIDYNLSHKDYFNDAEYWIELNGCRWMADQGAESVGSQEEPLPLQIKARGNWTRIGFSKKPFKIKLDKKQNLLGLTPQKNKHYALLAHADDNNGFMRNFTTFKLGEKIGLKATPRMQPVELVINGNYRGLYFLTESVRVGEGRVEIEELEDNATDPELISGGYIVELDNYDEENQIRMDEESCAPGQHLDKLRITFDTPEEYSDTQRRFITDQFAAINHAIGTNSNNTWSYLDLDDAARYYLVLEIVSQTEAFHGSTYLYRDRGEGQKWHFSPLWDAGNAFRGHTDDFFYNCDPFGNTWIPSMRLNTMFNNKVKETWLWFMSTRFSEIWNDLDNFSAHISEAVKSDNLRWGEEKFPSGGSPVADNSDIGRRLQDVKSHLTAKTKWLASQFGDYSNGNYPEPSHDTTPAALLPAYAGGAGVGEIINTPEASPQYYNLQGIKVNNPQKGEIYIIRQGSSSRKIIF